MTMLQAMMTDQLAAQGTQREVKAHNTDVDPR